MDIKKIMLDYVEYCAGKREEAQKEYGKYNGFTSQIAETRREAKLNGLQMATMAEFTKESLIFWCNKYDEAIKKYMELFVNSDEAYIYAKAQ